MKTTVFQSCMRMLLLLLTVIAFNTNQSRASHGTGTDFWYECIDTTNSVYRFYYVFYGDCGGISPSAPSLAFTRGACSGGSLPSAPPSQTMTLIDVNNATHPPMPFGAGTNPYNPVDSLIPSPTCPQTTCQTGGTIMGINAYVYYADVTLPKGCQWTITDEYCCRSADLTNIASPSSAGTQVNIDIYLNNVDHNSSIEPSQMPIIYVCGTSDTISYSLSGIDLDLVGDSVSYTLTNLRDDGGGAVLPYTATGTNSSPTGIAGSPFDTDYFYIESSTGRVEFKPTTASGSQVAVFAVLIEEFENGVLVSSYVREVQVNIDATCTNQIPGVTAVSDSGAAIQIKADTFEMCRGDIGSFTVVVTDPDGDALNISSDIAAQLPGLGSYVLNPITQDSVEITFTIDGRFIGANSYSFFVTINDAACFPSITSIEYTLIVYGAGYRDLVFCTNDPRGQVFPQIYGDTGVFRELPTNPPGLVLDSISGAITLNGATPSTTPGQTYGLVYVSASNTVCPTDSFNITVVDIPDASFTYATNLYCKQSSNITPLPIITGDLGGTFTSTAGLVIDPFTGEIDIVASTTGPHQVYYEINGGTCQDIDTFDLQITGIATFSADANTYFICPNELDTIDLTTTVVYSGFTPAGATYAWSPAAGVVDATLANTQAYLLEPDTFVMTYNDGLCDAQIDSVKITAPYPMNILVTTPVSICSGVPVQIGASGIVNGNNTQDFTYSGGNTTITPPIIGTQTTDFDLVVAGVAPAIIDNAIIQSLLVNLCINQPSTTRDIQIDLIGPNGTVVRLVNSGVAGGITNSSIPAGTSFSELSTTTIPNGIISTIPADVYQPQNSLTALIGGPTNGTWTLRVTHTNSIALGGQNGTLCGFSLTFQDLSAATFNWSPNTNISCTVCDSPTVSPPANTVYTVIGENLFGCKDTAAVDVLVTNALPQAVVSCGTVGPDSITFTWNPIAGVANYMVSIDNGTPFTVPASQLSYTVNGLASNQTVQFIIYGESGNLCADGAPDTVNCTTLFVCPSIDPMTITAAGPTTFCLGQSVDLDAGTASGTIYQWSANAGGATSQVVNVTAGGTYSVTVTDVAGCQDTGSIQVFIAPGPTPSINALGPVNVCAGQTVDLDAGAGFASYLWSQGSTLNTQVTTASVSGRYYVTVTDATGCQGVDSIDVVVNTPLVLTTSTVNVSCLGGNNGEVSIAASGSAGGYTYAWTNTAQTTATINNLTANTYCVTVTDALGCQADTCETITEPSTAVSVTVNDTTISCANSTDGELTAVAVGGVGTYTYTWTNTTQTTATINNLSANTYCVVATDLNGCTATACGTVNAINPIVLSGNHTDASCNGGSDGMATVSATGGAGGFTYAWSAGTTVATNDTVMNLSAGAVTVTVTDANNCTADITFTIGEPTAIGNPVFTQDSVSCFGGNDGQLNIVVTGGTPPYIAYAWNNSPQTTATITNLTVGSYTVTITDSQNCTFTATGDVFENTAVQTTATTTPVSCIGGNNGTLTVTPLGGVAPYAYQWSNTQTTATATGLAAGSHCVTITDFNGCSIDTCLTVTEPATAVSVAVNDTTISCSNSTDGELTAIGTGGTGTITYTWSTAGNTATINNLGAGTYCVTATDANGCQDSTCATVNPVSPITFTASDVDVSCNGGNDGTATINVSGGTGGFTYQWNTSTQTTATATNLVAGPHCVTATDANGCTVDTCIIVDEPAAIGNAQFVEVPVSCFGGNDGQLTVTVTGGVLPYTYQWSNGNFTQTATNLSATNYLVTITDDNNCIFIANSAVTQPTVLQLNFAVNDVNCKNGNDGNAEAIVTGGTQPYTYQWSNSATGPIANNLVAGNYDVTVTDRNGCTITGTIPVGEPSAILVANIIAQQDLTCNGDSNATATVDALGGTPNYTFVWSTSAGGQTTATATNLTAGSYSVTATDSKGCTASTSVTIREPAALVINALITSNYNGAHISCHNSTDGSANVVAAGGTGGYTYSWSPNGSNTASIDSLAAGTYTVTVTDITGCTKVDSVEIIAPIELQASFTKVDIFCHGDQDGQIVVAATPGTGTLGGNGYEYAITGPNQTGFVFSGINSFSNLAAGNYTVYVRDGNDCEVILPITINEPAVLEVDSMEFTMPSCNGGNDGTATVTPKGGTAPYSYTWNTNPQQTTQTATGLSAGTYEVSVTDFYNCSMTVATVTVTDPVVLTATVTGTNVSCLGGNNGTATASAAGGMAPYTYVWSTGDTTSTLNLLTAGTYDVTVTDNLGCQVVESVVLTEPSTVVSVTATVDNPSCNGQATGQATAIPSGGTAPYTYLWNTLPQQTTATATNLTPGIYTVAVTDSLGCTEHFDVTITQPTPLVVDITSIGNAACNGTATGTATVVATGGSGNYSYAWSSGDSTAVTTSLLGDSLYYVTVTDANGCTGVDSVQVGQPTGVTIDSFITTAVSCKDGNDGSVLVDPSALSGGTLPYNFSWSMSSSTSNFVDGLAAGTYYLTITDGNACPTVDSFTIEEPATSVDVFVNSTPALCAGAASGEMAAIASGGTPFSDTTYLYNWSNGATTDVVDSVGAGTYYLTVTDANGCQAFDTVVIDDATPIVTTVTKLQDAGCFGASNGAASVSATGGTGSFLYIWSDATTNNIVTGLNAGWHYVTVTDAANGCQAIDSVEIEELDSIELTIDQQNVSCFGGNDGSLAITGSSIPLNASYWPPNPINQSSISNLTAGVYELRITATNGCQQSYSYEITEPTALTASVMQGEALLCYGDSTSMLMLTVDGGAGSYSIAWNTGDSTMMIDSVYAGTFSVTATDANGCEISDTVVVAQPEKINFTAAATGLVCVDQATGTIALSNPSGGVVLSGLYEYSIDSMEWQTGNLFNNLLDGIYTVYVRDDNGCIVDTMITVEGADPFFIVDATQDTTMEYLDSIVLGAELNDTTGVNFTWSVLNGNTLELLTDSLLADTLVPANSGIYVFSATNANGCIVDTTVRIDVIKPRRVNLPSAFTPNGDGVNDILYLQGGDKVEEVTIFRVFDRWGNLVYEGTGLTINDENSGWDGTYKGKLMNSGTFVWYAEVLFKDGHTEVIKGDITILR